MTAHRAAYDLFKAEASRQSSVDAEVIYVDASPLVVNLRSTAAQTRTLALPTRQGAIVTLHMQLDGGDITVTVASAYTEAGATTFVFSDPGQSATFVSLQNSAGVYLWRLISHYGLANVTPAGASAAADIAALVALTDNSGGAAVDDTIAVVTAPAAPAAVTNYTAHAAGATPVVSAAATDLDTTAAAVATAVDELTALTVIVAGNRTAIIALTDAVTELSTKINAIIAAAG